MPKFRKTFCLVSRPFCCATIMMRTSIEPAHAGDDRVVVGECAIAVQFMKSGEQPLDVIERMRTLGMTRELHALPARIAWLRGLGIGHE